MIKILYVAWFRNLKLQPTDQNYDWPACFYIIGKNSSKCMQWGDKLSKTYAEKTNELFLRSCEDNEIETYNNIPIIK